MVGVRVAQVPAHKQSLIVCTAETTQTRLAYISISYGGSIITVPKKKKHIVTAIMMLTESILWSAPINTVHNTAAVFQLQYTGNSLPLLNDIYQN